jgi:hypothetical protein
MTPVIHQTPARRGVVVVGLITAFYLTRRGQDARATATRLT